MFIILLNNCTPYKADVNRQVLSPSHRSYAHFIAESSGIMIICILISMELVIKFYVTLSNLFFCVFIDLIWA